jgi:hypothetical protein
MIGHSNSINHTKEQRGIASIRAWGPCHDISHLTAWKEETFLNKNQAQSACLLLWL